MVEGAIDMSGTSGGESAGPSEPRLRAGSVSLGRCDRSRVFCTRCDLLRTS